MRDNRGRFVRGHPLINSKDETTGRFAKKKPTNRHDEVVKEIDEFFKKKEEDHADIQM